MEYDGEFLNNKKLIEEGNDENGNIIYELINGNGKVKEYNSYDNNFEFEGEYLDGLRNGKEKEYGYDGKLIFEGEYLNGQRNGKGKEYYDGKLIFEGEYLYNHYLKGKYYINEKLEYDREYLSIS